MTNTAQLGDISELIKLQKNGTPVYIVEKFGGTYLQANNLLVRIDEFHQNGDNYLLYSPLKQLFLRLRKNGELGLVGTILTYNSQPLDTLVTAIGKTNEDTSNLRLVEFYEGDLIAPKMNIKEDVTGWSSHLFLVFQNGNIYFGLTNLDEFNCLISQGENSADEYYLLPYDQNITHLSADNGLYIALNNDKAIIFNGVFGYELPAQPMTTQQIKQFNILSQKGLSND